MEHANRNIGQIFWAVIRHDQKDWVDHVDLTEFTINMSIAEMMKFAPFKLNGGYMPSMMKKIGSDEAIPRGIRSFAEAALQNLANVHNTIIEVHVFQMSCTYTHRKNKLEIVEGTLMYLNLQKKRAKNLCSKFIGPWKVTKVWLEISMYELELPTALWE